MSHHLQWLQANIFTQLRTRLICNKDLFLYTYYIKLHVETFVLISDKILASKQVILSIFNFPPYLDALSGIPELKTAVSSRIMQDHEGWSKMLPDIAAGGSCKECVLDPAEYCRGITGNILGYTAIQGNI